MVFENDGLVCSKNSENYSSNVKYTQKKCDVYNALKYKKLCMQLYLKFLLGKVCL